MGRKKDREIAGLGFSGRKSDEYESVNPILRDGLADAYGVLTGKIEPCNEETLANIVSAQKISEDLTESEVTNLIRKDLQTAADEMRKKCRIPNIK